MKIYSFATPLGQNRGYAGRDYVIELDNNIGSVIDYIQNFNPNYQILNYTINNGKPYYSAVELTENLGLYNLDPTTWTAGDFIVDISKLPTHMGLYNNFNNIDKVHRKYQLGSNGPIYIGPEGTVIISTAMPVLPEANEATNRLSIKDYFIARLSAAASFYQFLGSINQKHTYTGQYLDRAENIGGTEVYMTLIPFQPRFVSNLVSINQDTKTVIFQSRGGDHTHTVKTQKGSGGIKSNALLNHEVIYQSSATSLNDCEEVFTDDTYSLNLDKDKNSQYIINVEKLNLHQLPNTKIYVG